MGLHLSNNIQLMLEFVKAPFIVLHFSFYDDGVPDDVIYYVATFPEDNTLYSKFEQVSDLWQ